MPYRLPRPFPDQSLLFLACGLLPLLWLAGCKPSSDMETLRQLQSEGDYQATVDPLRELVLTRPHDPEVNYLYGRALVATQRASLATWPLLEAMKDPEWLAPAGFQLAFARLATGDYNEVIEIANRLLERDSQDLQALFLRAQARAHWKTDPAAALADAERVLELDPSFLEAYEPRILALLALDRQAEASEVLAEAGRRLAASDAPESRLSWHCSTTAIFAVEGGELERARETWEKCLSDYPTEPVVVWNAVNFFDGQGELERSIQALRVALAHAPATQAFRVGMADRMRLRGEAAEAEALLHEATDAEDPGAAARAWVDLGNFRSAQGEYAAAADALERAIELNREAGPPPPQLMFRYADQLLSSGQVERAQEVASSLTVPAQRKMLLARIAQWRGDNAGALELFDEALPLWPDNVVARFYAGVAAERLGHFDRALEEYRYAVRIDVGATEARTRAAQLLVAQGQYTQAYGMLFFQVAEAPLDLPGQLLSLYLIARVANPSQLQAALETHRRIYPSTFPGALIRAAQGAAERVGASAGMHLLRSAPGIDYSDPRHSSVLRALVHYAHEAAEPAVGRKALAAALEAHPQAAVFQEIRGLDLELGGAPAEQVAAAYERALELEPSNPGALAGLARLSLAADPAKALALFERAATAAPGDPAPKLAAAQALRVSGEFDEARRRLDLLLAMHPFDGAVAAERVAVDLEAGVATSETLERARQAVRFGGGPEAFDRLSEVYTRLEQPKEAAEAADHAQRLRELSSAGG